MRNRSVILTTALAMLINLSGMGLAPLSVAAAPASARYGAEVDASQSVLPSSLTYKPAPDKVDRLSGAVSSDILPSWFANVSGAGVRAIYEDENKDENEETYTDQLGQYRFEGLPYGTHKVTIDAATLPPGLRPDGEEAEPILWLTPGQTQTSQALSTGVRFTAAYDRESGAISGLVFSDQDGDGQPGPAEPRIAGVRVMDPTVHQYFVPFRDVDLWTLFVEKDQCYGLTPDPPLNSFVFLTSGSDDTVYYYDHWEDGYDVDPLSPGSTTEVGVVDSGVSHVFESHIDPAQVGGGPPFYYDGRDRITIFGEDAAVVRLVYPDDPGTVLAAAWEVPEVADWGTSYIATVGEDLAFTSDHAYAGLEVMAWQDGTDVYRNGTLVATLDAGQVHFIDGGSDGAGGEGVDSDDTITATAPIQVQMMTGACAGDAYSAHGYSLQPVDVWHNAYWAPVPGFESSPYCSLDASYPDVDTDIYLRNPHPYGITVTVSSDIGTFDVAIPPATTVSTLDEIPWPDVSTGNYGAYLSSTEIFWGIVVVDSSTNGDTDAQVYDWGYGLVPESELSSQVVIGYAPGNADGPPPTDNGNLAFVTAVTDTVIYVDLDQDGLPDPVDMNGDGDAVDADVWGVTEWDEPLSALGISVQAGQALRVGDPYDHDLTGALIYTANLLDKIAVAWGQDPCSADIALPYLDLGYTILPVPVPRLSKVDELAIDADLSGEISPGDTITYALVLYNNGLGSMNNVVLTDTLPFTHTDFVVGSLRVTTPPPVDTIDYYDGTSWATDPVADAQMFRITWNTIGPGQSVTVALRVRLHMNVPVTVTEITNRAMVDSTETVPAESEDPDDPADPDTDTPVARPLLSIDKVIYPTTIQPGGHLSYTVVVSNYGNGVALLTTITDALPLWLTYVTGTLDLTWPVPQVEVDTRSVTHTSFFHGNYADDFDLTAAQTSAYTGNDGSLAWLTDWNEINDDDDPTSGNIRVEEVALDALSIPAYLRMGDGGAGVRRTADLSQFRAPWLRYYVFGETDEADDQYIVEIGTVSPPPERYDGDYTLQELDLSAISGTAVATLHFTATSSMDPDDYYRFDNIAIYETDPERVVTKTLTWERTVLSYTTSTGGDPLSYDRLTGQMVITQGMRLPPGGFITVTFQAQAAIPLTDSLTLTNVACVTSTNWTDVLSSPCDDAPVQVLSNHTLTATKTADPTPVEAGGLLTYTIHYIITGDEAVSSVVISETTPQYTTFYTATPTPDSDPGVGGVGPVIWQMSGLWPPGSGITQSSGIVSMVVLVDSALVSGTAVVNSVIITDTAGGTTSDTVATPILAAADISVVKTDSADPVVAGETMTYTLAVYNAGPSDAQDVMVTDTLPVEVTFVDATPPYNYTPPPDHTIVWDLGTLRSGDTRMLTVVVQVETWVTQTFTNAVNIATSTPETDYTNNDDDEPTDVNPLTDVTIAKSDDVDPVVPGDPLVYTLVYTNNGPSDAKDVVVADTLPPEVAFVDADPGQDTGPNPLVWNLGTLAAGDSGTIRITVTVHSWVTRTFTNAAHIATSTPETDYTNNDDDEPTDVEPLADVTIAKSDDVDPVVPGDPLVYTLVYTNNGPSDAEDVVVADTLPPEVAFVDADPGQDSGPNPLVWNLGTLAAGDSGTIRITVTVHSWVTRTFTNAAHIATSTSETDYTNNDDDEPTDVNPLADVTIAKSDDVDPVVPGDPLVYTLVYTNNGPSDAEDVVVADTLPPEVAFVDADPGQDSGPNPLVWNLGTLAAGDSGTIRITVTVHSWVTRTFTNTAHVATSTPETDYTNNDDDEPTDVDPLADVTIAKSDDVDPVVPGDPLVYTLVYTNNGPSDAEDVVVADTLPPEVAFGDADPGQDSGPNPLVWNLGTLAAGDSGTIRITVTVHSWVTQTFTNAAHVATSTPETDYTNNDDDEPTSVPTDIAIAKSDDVDPVVPGDPVVYTLVYTNNGPFDAEDVVVADTLPAEVAFVDADPSQAAGPNPLVWNLGTLAAGDSGTIRITVTVHSWVTRTFTNVVNIATSTPETDYTNNDDDEPTDVNPLADVTIAKSDDVDPVVPGDPLVYTLVYTNNGPSDAEDVVVADTLPPEVAFVDADPGQDTGPNPLVWNLGTLAAGDSGTIRITVTVHSWVTRTFTNVVSIATSTPETDYTNNDDDEPTDVNPLTDVTIVKSDDDDPVVPGDPLVYTLVYTNNGPSDAEDVVVADTLPTEVAFVDADPGQDSGPNPLVWNLGTLAAGDSGTIRITVTVHSWVTRTFTNVVSIATSTSETDYVNNDDDEPTTPLVPGLRIVKLAELAQVVPNMPVTYTIRITNTGDVTFTTLVLTDTLPPAFYYVVGSGQPTDPDVIAEPVLVWRDLGPLAPANSLTVTYSVTTTSQITGDYVNMATAAGTTPGGVVTDTGDATVTVEEPRIIVNKTVVATDTDEVAPNYVTFTIAITNVGPSAVDILPLEDQYDPYYLAFEDATPYPEDDADDGIIAWSDLTGPAPYGFGRDLLPGDVFLVTTVFRVAHDIVVTTTNTAIVTDAIDVYGNPVGGEDDETEIGGGPGIPTPVEVLYLRAVAEETAVRIEWATAAELGTIGFHVYRGPSASFRDAQAVGYVLATGPDSTYNYADRDVTPDQPYWYWLVEEVSFGDPDSYGPVRGAVEIDALRYRLHLPLIQRRGQDQTGMPTGYTQGQLQPRWAEWAFGNRPSPGTMLLASSPRRWD